MTGLSNMLGGRMTTRDSMHGKCWGALLKVEACSYSSELPHLL